MNKTNDFILLAVVGIIGIICFFAYRALSKRPLSEDNKKAKKVALRKKMLLIIAIIAAWFCLGTLITLFFGTSTKQLHVELFSSPVKIGMFEVGSTALWSCGITAFVLILALIFRFFIFPGFKEEPKGIQNMIELVIETVDKFTNDALHHPLGDNIAAYVLTVGCYMIFCALLELFSVRAPTSDIITTASLALMTFLMINYFGIKIKGVKGRISSLMQPNPIILPINLLSNLAIPISLACRLFGNMLGGLIIMELLYVALGNMAIGIPAVAGLYFNVFHPLIQAYIFITLTLTFINEAIE